MFSHIYVWGNANGCTVFCVVANVINKDYVKALGRRIIELRNAKGWSQEQLANLADIPVNQVGRVERGEINTTVSTVYAISKALKVKITDMYDFPFQGKE